MNVYLDLLLLCAARWWNGLRARQPAPTGPVRRRPDVPPHPVTVAERTSADQCGPSIDVRHGARKSDSRGDVCSHFYAVSENENLAVNAIAPRELLRATERAGHFDIP